jgi:hypothetical protein
MRHRLRGRARSEEGTGYAMARSFTVTSSATGTVVNHDVVRLTSDRDSDRLPVTDAVTNTWPQRGAS